MTAITTVQMITIKILETSNICIELEHWWVGYGVNRQSFLENFIFHVPADDKIVKDSVKGCEFFFLANRFVSSFFLTYVNHEIPFVYFFIYSWCHVFESKVFISTIPLQSGLTPLKKIVLEEVEVDENGESSDDEAVAARAWKENQIEYLRQIANY